MPIDSNKKDLSFKPMIWSKWKNGDTGELGYDRLNGTRQIGPSYAKSVVYI